MQTRCVTLRRYELIPPFFFRSCDFSLNSSDYLHVCSGADLINEVQNKNLQEGFELRYTPLSPTVKNGVCAALVTTVTISTTAVWKSPFHSWDCCFFFFVSLKRCKVFEQQQHVMGEFTQRGAEVGHTSRWALALMWICNKFEFGEHIMTMICCFDLR